MSPEIFYICNMFEKMFNIFDSLISKLDAKAEREFINGLVPRYATGNVLAQQGHSILSEDIERRKKKILSYHFGVL